MRVSTRVMDYATCGEGAGCLLLRDTGAREGIRRLAQHEDVKRPCKANLREVDDGRLAGGEAPVGPREAELPREDAEAVKGDESPRDGACGECQPRPLPRPLARGARSCDGQQSERQSGRQRERWSER